MQTDDIEAILRTHGQLLGGRTSVSRGGWHSRISVPLDGNLPLDGVLPSVIDRGGRGAPVLQMPESGARLVDFLLEHPDTAMVAALYERLGIRDGPRLSAGPRARYVATIETAAGIRTLC